MQEAKPNKLQTYTFRTPEVLKAKEIYRIKGELKAEKRAKAMSDRQAKQIAKMEKTYQAQLARNISRMF